MSKTVPALLLMLAAVLAGAPANQGKNTVWVRGRGIDVYHIPAAASGRPARKVLFAPGDGGWRGFAISMAQEMASWGYDVYSIDTKRYLEAFTTGTGALNESQVMTDMAAIARSVRAGNEKVILAGWSEGAGLCLLGAAGPGSRDVFTGVAAIGLGERTALGWRLADNITWITKRAPDEPSFTSLPYMARISPLPLAMVHSSGDEYTSVDAAKKLFAGAAEPKRLAIIPARNHRFDGGREPFFKALAAALEWIGGEPQ